MGPFTRLMATAIGLAFVAGACTQILDFDDYNFTETFPGGGTGGVGGTLVGGGGTGGAPGCTAPSDCPGSDTDCATRTCVDETCGVEHAAAGTACDDDGGQVCDGSGSCVECVEGADCPSGICNDNQCAPDTCTDGVLSGDETDIDCGGACPPCAVGQSCLDADDCVTRFCDDGSSGTGGAGGAAGGAGGASGGAGGGTGAGGAPGGASGTAGAGGALGGAGPAGGNGGGGGAAPSGPICATCIDDLDCAPATGTHCDASSGSCEDSLPNGSDCERNSQCASTFCQPDDGVCCESACDGECVACVGLKTGGADGSCLPVTASTDPDGECGYEPPSSCGPTGNGCNGDSTTPGCVVYASGTECAPQVCSSGIETAASLCDGDGTCVDGAATPCGLYRCDSQGLICETSCSDDGACNSTAYCDTSASACVAKKADGLACSGANECVSGHCADGYCCDTGCIGNCEVCDQSGSLGICTVVGAGATGDPSCAPYFCDGSSGSCPSSCADDTDCVGSSYCDHTTTPSTCFGKKGLGGSCSAGTECQSDLCVDGYCCSTDCTGFCMACNVGGSLGTCTDVPAGTNPDGDCPAGDVCDGAGACSKGDGTACSSPTECLNGYCEDGVCCESACSGVCRACSSAKTGGADGVCGFITAGTNPDGDCVGGLACDGAGFCKKETGETCSSGPDCLTGLCVDGRCCATACTGTCEACNLSGTEGTCTAVPWGSDPDGNCPGGTCNGARDCALPDGQSCVVGTDCISGECVDGVCCDTACGSICFACTAAKTGGSDGTCAAVSSGTDPDTDCATTERCDGLGVCKKIDGQGCGAGGECLTGNCIDSYCCNTTCSGVCEACDGALTIGASGVCSPVTAFTDPDGNCAAGSSCNGAGACKKLDGQGCTLGTECMSGNCPADDSVCCDAACEGVCEACTTAKTGGVTGDCAVIPNDQDPDGECGANAQCNGANACKLIDGQTCTDGAECLSGHCVDGFCCNTGCTNICEACDGSLTIGASGVCSPVTAFTDPDGNCAPGSACDGAGVCKKLDGQGCSAGTECLNGHCPPDDGICCDAACEGVCEACLGTKTGGTDGSCAVVPNDQDPDGECGATGQCNGANACKLIDGQGCSDNAECLNGYCVDGFCCDTDCAGICEACDGSLTIGASGVCNPVTAFTDPDGNCAAGSSCDGAGVCKKLDGQGCSAGTECMSGNCPASDNVCCDLACGGLCESCLGVDTGGLDGDCAVIPDGDDPDNECGDPAQCNGANECKLIDGQGCSDGAECLSGECVDGVCCNTACTGTCWACSAAKTGGTDGTCAYVTINENFDGDCVAGQACDGAGACKLVDGQSCSGNDGECVYNHCVDGYCCNSACSGTCESCDGALTIGDNGVCSAVTAYLNPNGTDCAVNEACDGARNCKLLEGASCGTGTECLSGNCPSPDGVCCNVACDGLCEACTASQKGTGSDGTCGFVEAGNNLENDCASERACDGAGACKTLDGELCAADGECLNGHCPQPDGVCCNAACTDICYGCTSLRTGLPSGQCGPITEDTDPDLECTYATQRCDGAGVCRHLDGAGCSVPGDCLSFNCSDGYCCNLPCSGTCESCAALDTGGTNGVCSFVEEYKNPNGTHCSTNYACDGLGTCKLEDGVSGCGSDGALCISGFCPGDDGVCCTSACNTECEACLASKTGVSGSDGTCYDIPVNQDPDGECLANYGTAYECNGSGACLGLTGQAHCTVDADCFSNECSLEPGLNWPGGEQNICCSTDCSATCYSCLEGKTGVPGSDGTCNLIIDGTDPDDECFPDTKFCEAGACK